MCSMALRWLARRLLDSFRSPMMWSIARRCSSRLRRRSSSVSTWARRRPSAVAAGSGSVTASTRSAVTALSLRLDSQALQLLLEGDHLQLAAHDHFLEFLEIQDLLLQLALGFLQVANHLLVGAHVAQDADGADHLAVRVAQRGGIEGRGDHRSARAAGVEPGVAGDAP